MQQGAESKEQGVRRGSRWAVPTTSNLKFQVNRGLHRFAVLTAGATFVLIFMGGLVTSTGSGLAVPDWPLSFGQVFPPMVGGVLYEHGHRMMAALVGLLTTILAVWIYLRDPRGWVRGLGVAALMAIILQGLLGGLTVLLLLPTPVSVAHACLAQGFFCLTVALAVFTGPGWRERYGSVGKQENRGPRAVSPTPPRSRPPLLSLTQWGALTTAVIYIQLILGAVMRHMGAGLAIPDFPLAYGRLVPPLESEAIFVHFLHRLGALLVTLCVVWTFLRVARHHRQGPVLLRPASLLVVLLVIQVTLGAFTIWTLKAVLPTTAHVAVGAALLATSLVLTLRAHRLPASPKFATNLGFVSSKEVPA